jgi:hypothetical protein
VFEELAQCDDLPHVDDAALVDAVNGWTRAAASVAHHRMAAIAELTTRRCASEQAVERQLWACDGWDSAAAEIAAASGISPRAASTQMCQGLALRHRLPQVAKLVAEGTLAAPLPTPSAGAPDSSRTPTSWPGSMPTWPPSPPRSARCR